MSGVVAAASSSSCSATFSSSSSSSNHSIKNSQLHPHYFKSLLNPSSQSQKTSFQGLSLREAKSIVSDSFFVVENTKGSAISRRGLEIAARAAGAAKTIEVEVDKPLGLTLGQKSGGGVVITAVEGGGNAAKAGLKTGDQVLYTSSFFGDELWPADKLGFTKTAIQAKPDSVYFVVSRFTFVIGFLLLLTGAALNDQHGGDESMYFGTYYCYVVKPGVFAGGSILSLASAAFGIVYYITLSTGKITGDGMSSMPNQGGGIAMGQPQFPPTQTSQEPVFVHEDTYIRRQFT